MKKYIILLSLVLLSLTTIDMAAIGVPATPYPIETTQPDGKKLTIRLVGDERAHFTTTKDGWLILQAENNFYYYAVSDGNGGYKISKRKARNEETRSKSDKKFLEKNGIPRNQVKMKY